MFPVNHSLLEAKITNSISSNPMASVASGGLQDPSPSPTATRRTWSCLSIVWRLWWRLVFLRTRLITNWTSIPACCQSPASRSAPTSSCPPPWPPYPWPLQLNGLLTILFEVYLETTKHLIKKFIGVFGINIYLLLL